MTAATGLTATLVGGSTSNFVELLIFACAFGLVGYRISVRHRAVRGVTPWRLPSAVWALICFLFWLLGILVEYLAGATTKPVTPLPPGPGGPSAGRPGDGDLRPLPLQASATATLQVAPALPGAAPALRPPMSDREDAPALFGWYPDVTGRHQKRYFDGRKWNALVADDGVIAEDPL